jgi:hypothetical protein
MDIGWRFIVCGGSLHRVHTKLVCTRYDEDMTHMHMSMNGAWSREGVQQSFPNQGGARLIQFESPRWRPKETQVQGHLGVQEQLAVKSTPRSHTGGKII